LAKDSQASRALDETLWQSMLKTHCIWYSLEKPTQDIWPVINWIYY